MVEQACTNQRILDLKYQDIHGQQTQRLVEPICITFYNQNWHLIAFCLLRNDYRDFSLNRILKLEETTQTFSRSHLSLPEYIEKIKNYGND